MAVLPGSLLLAFIVADFFEVCVCERERVFIYRGNMHSCTHIHRHTHTFTHPPIYAHMHTHIHTHIHTHTHTHTHTCTHW